MTADKESSDGDRQQYTQDDFAIGDSVVDREQGEAADVAVVVNRPPMAAEEWEAYRTDGEVVTVADDNPGYDASSKVVVVMYPDDLEEWGVEWEGEDPLSLGDAPMGTAYAFPPNRLEAVGTYFDNNESAERTETAQEDAGTDDSGSDANGADPAQEGSESDFRLRERLDAIAGVVEDLNVDSVAVDTFREAVVVEKLGEQYEIEVDGCVAADDPLAKRIEDTIAEQLDGQG